MGDIYLDEEGEEKVPVPRYLWKVVYHAGSRRGVAVVGANNPHHEEPEPCAAVLPSVSWLRFTAPTSLAAGVLTACSVEDFQATVTEFPATLDTSGGLLV